MMKKQTVSFFAAGRQGAPTKAVTTQEVYDLVRSGQLAEVTQTIIQDFFDDIADGFKRDKKPYQDAKHRLLSSVCFSGYIDRTAGVPDDFHHTGLLTLDIDGNGKAKQDEFLALVKTGKLVYFEAAARSVSGYITGDCWANVRIEIPAEGEKVDRKLIALLQRHFQLSKDYTRSALLNALHKAYLMAFQAMFADIGMTIGKAADLKRTRYLTHDNDIYINDNAQQYKLQHLTAFLEQRKEEQRVDEVITANVKETDAFRFAEAYTSAKGLTFVPGQRHNFRVTMAVALNLLGVSKAAAEKYIYDHYRPADGNVTDVTSVYRSYYDSHGKWKYKLKPEVMPADKTIALTDGQYLSDVTPEIVDYILEQKKVCLKAGTGIGKSYAAATVLAKLLTAKNGCVTVIIMSLNAKAEKDALQYGIPIITGERLKAEGENKERYKKAAMASPIIITSQNYFPHIARHFKSIGEQLNTITDESHSIVTGQSYRKDVIHKMYSAIEAVSATVTLLSGTPSEHLRKAGYSRLEVTKDRPAIELVIKTRKTGDIAKTALHHINNTDFSKKRLVIKMESRKQIALTEQALLKTGWHPSQILCLYADIEVKATADFQQFLSANKGQESFSHDVKVILTTKVIGEGLDVYSDSVLEFVAIERAQTFDVRQLVQFFDRHRTDKAKTVTLYTTEQTKEVKPFNSHKLYDEYLSLYQGHADVLNKKLAEAADDEDILRPLYNLKTGFDRFSEYVFFNENTGQYEVNLLVLAAKIEEQEISITNTDKAIQVISDLYPYFTINDQRKTTTGSTAIAGGSVIDEDSLKALKVVQQQQQKEAERNISALFLNSPDIFLQAVGSRTDDLAIRQKTQFDERRKQYVEGMVSANSDLFQRHLKTAERLAKKYYQAQTLNIGFYFKDLFFTTDDAGNTTMKSAEAWSNFTTALRLQLLIHLFLIATGRRNIRLKHNIDATQTADAVMMANIIKDVKKHTGQRFESKELAKLVNKHVTGHQPYTQRQAVTLVTTFFKIKRITGKKAEYEIGQYIGLDDFLKRHKIDEKQYKTNWYNDLNSILLPEYLATLT